MNRCDRILSQYIHRNCDRKDDIDWYTENHGTDRHPQRHECLHSRQYTDQPLQPRLMPGTVGAMVLNFKSVITRSSNRMKRSPGRSIWQRDYYEHVIRNEEALNYIRQYIHNNPPLWQEDQLHPDNPSKW